MTLKMLIYQRLSVYMAIHYTICICICICITLLLLMLMFDFVIYVVYKQ